MSLGSDLTDALPELRRQAESRMTASCTITVDGVKTWNPETLQFDDTDVVVYTGPCRVKRRDTQDSVTTVAEQTFIEAQYEVHLPVASSGAVVKNAVVLVTGCPDDAELVGRRFTVVAVPAGSQVTARRIPVREVQ